MQKVSGFYKEKWIHRQIRMCLEDTLNIFCAFSSSDEKNKICPFLWSISGKCPLYFLYNPAFKKFYFRSPSLKWLLFYNQHLNSALNCWNKVIISQCASCQRAFSILEASRPHQFIFRMELLYGVRYTNTTQCHYK